MTTRLAALLIGAVISGSAMAQGAPGDARFCQSYAANVSGMAGRAIKKNPACLDYSKGVHDSFQMHADWCAKNPAPSVRGAEANIRRLVAACTGNAPPSAGAWTMCAPERQRCVPPYPTMIRYGADGAYRFKGATGPILCDNAVFGDPLPGVPKACAFKVKE